MSTHKEHCKQADINGECTHPNCDCLNPNIEAPEFVEQPKDHVLYISGFDGFHDGVYDIIEERPHLFDETKSVNLIDPAKAKMYANETIAVFPAYNKDLCLCLPPTKHVTTQIDEFTTEHKGVPDLDAICPQCKIPFKEHKQWMK